MLVTLKPRFGSPRAADRGHTLGVSSQILYASARSHHWSGTGCLSIKSFTGGEALYDTGRGHFRVDARRYLVLNAGESYSITVDSRTTTESFCIFFEDGLAEEIGRSLGTADRRLLDDPYARGPAVRFFERTYPHDEVVTPALASLREGLASHLDDPEWIDRRLRRIVIRLLRAHRGLYREIDALPAARASTREELYRRLQRARDFAEASLGRAITLDDIAKIACLSPTHLLRTFRQLFGETPHRYLVRRRLEHAAELLAASDRSVTEVCLEVGYESLGSFSSLFRRRYGISPDRYRRPKR
jgi:AraC-like DNA-binding protein